MESFIKGPKLLNNKFFHFGVSVQNIDNTIKALFDLFVGKVSVRRNINHRYLGNLIGEKSAEADVVMFETCAGEFIEILSWRDNSTSVSDLNNIKSKFTSHICFYVENIELYWDRVLRSNSLQALSREVIVVPIGPNKGSKVFFVNVNGEFYIELFQRI